MCRLTDTINLTGPRATHGLSPEEELWRPRRSCAPRRRPNDQRRSLGQTQRGGTDFSGPRKIFYKRFAGEQNEKIFFHCQAKKFICLINI